MVKCRWIKQENYRKSLSVLTEIDVNSFTTEIGSRKYHVFREAPWDNISLHGKVKIFNNDWRV